MTTPASSSDATTVFTPPLTTAWEYAPECSNLWYYLTPDRLLIQDEHIPEYRSCQPPQLHKDTARGDALTLSPGVCPSGWTIGKIETRGTQTEGMCCLEGFTASQWLICSSSLGSEAWTVPYIAEYGAATVEPQETVVSSVEVVHLAISAYWEEKDIATLHPWATNAGPSGAPQDLASEAGKSLSVLCNPIVLALFWIVLFSGS